MISPTESKSRLQFSLRTLLLAVGACCLFMGLRSWGNGLGVTLCVGIAGVVLLTYGIYSRDHSKAIMGAIMAVVMFALSFSPSVANSHADFGVSVPVLVLDDTNGEPISGAMVSPVPLDGVDKSRGASAASGGNIARTARDGTATVTASYFVHWRRATYPFTTKLEVSARPLSALAVDARGYDAVFVPLSDFEECSNARNTGVDMAPPLVFASPPVVIRLTREKAEH